MARTKIYVIWAAMLARCERPSDKAFPSYGGRGITVSPEWHAFENFYRDMGDRPNGMSLERIDNGKGYSKENCEWAPIYRQNTNKRNNRYLEAFGRKLPITWWGNLIGVGSSHLGKMLKKRHLEDIIIDRVGEIGANYL